MTKNNQNQEKNTKVSNNVKVTSRKLQFFIKKRNMKNSEKKTPVKKWLPW